MVRCPRPGDPIEYNRREVVHGTLVAAGRDRRARIVEHFRSRPAPYSIDRPTCLPGISPGRNHHVRPCPAFCNCFTSLSAVNQLISNTSRSRSDQVDIVGVFLNYATVYGSKAKAQQTVDNAHMRYFVVHLHRLLDPGQDAFSS